MGTRTPRRSAASTSRAKARARLLLLAVVVGTVAATAAATRAAEPVPEAARLLGWVRDLSDPAMEGRGSGTPGADRAASYLEAEFRRLGLRPAGDGGGFLQRFDVLTGVQLAPGATIEATAPGATPRTFAGGSDFLPFTFSADGDVAGDVVFAGYGITAPPLGYDDYAGLDVRSKVVLVMTGEPRETDPRGPFRPAEHFHYTELRHKVLNAREHGAVAVIVVENPGRDDRLTALRGTTPSWGIVAISARREVGDALLALAGRDLAGLRAEIERAGAPASRAVPGARARIRSTLLRDRGTTANVVAILQGADPALAAEAVVIGAHYDHLGRGSPFSLAPERGDAIHPGADDNASGTAALLGVAETLVRTGGSRRSVVIVAFSGEELGLLGSTHYVSQPAVPIDRTVAMVNLDSVGRLRDGRLHVMGVDTGQGLRALVEQAAQGLPEPLTLRGDGVGPSDHTAFLNRERPVVFFLSASRLFDRRAVLRVGLAGAAALLREHITARRARAQAGRRAAPGDPRERHLAGLRQLTLGGQNAEAYWDRSGTRLVFQSTRPPFGCDQIFTVGADGTDVRLVSTGRGRTTCAFFSADSARILYASTHHASADCPPPADRSGGYVWPLYDYDLYTCATDGGDLQRLMSSPGYDAEGTIAPDGRIVFTSMRDGDLDLYVMDGGGGNVRRLTDRSGYDGGPFFSWDGRDIVWRGWHPTDPGELSEYRALLGRGLVRPSRAELFVMAADGAGVRQVTSNGAASWAPFLHPDGERIVFSSNLHDPGRFDFALYLIRRDGRGLERLTHAESFASFPMFSADGRRLVFCSSRGAAQPREFNIFVADWVV